MPLVYGTSFIGIIATPCVVVYLLLTQLSIWDGIQSWMIAYITWGIVSYSIFMIYVAAVYFIDDASEGYLNILNDLLMFTLGIDVGEFNVNSIIMSRYFIIFSDLIKGKQMDVLILMITPFVASLLPATVIGFVANFILLEKYELRCREEYLEGDVCFDSNSGCCQVISSYDWDNMYLFMGGLSSNILAIWAVIKILGYIMVHADPFLATYVKRRR